MKFRKLSARPRHHAQAEGAIEAFKKTVVVQTRGTRTNVSGSLRCLQVPSIAFQIPGAAPP
jgi:hypothetical protein